MSSLRASGCAGAATSTTRSRNVSNIFSDRSSTSVHGQAISPQFELSGFAEAFDGPPTDPKAFEVQWKTLQEKRIRDEILQQQRRIRDDTLQPDVFRKTF